MIVFELLAAGRRADVEALMSARPEQALLTHCADCQKTPLMLAVESCDPQMVEILLPFSDMGARDRGGWTVADHVREADSFSIEPGCGLPSPPGQEHGIWSARMARIAAMVERRELALSVEGAGSARIKPRWL